jgi:hypothetical protein
MTDYEDEMMALFGYEETKEKAAPIGKPGEAKENRKVKE